MWILFLFGVFESFLFPHNILFENQFNPATLYHERFEIVAGTEIKFGLAELRTYSIYSHLKSYGFDMSSFGNDIYRENVIGFGFGFPVINKLAVGVHISILNYWIKDYCSRFQYSFRVGSIFQSNLIEISIWINNINAPRFSDVDYLPLGYSLGCRYLARDNLSFNFALQGVEDNLPFFTFGVSYAPYKIIEFAAGINTEPMLPRYGAKFNVGDFTVGYSGDCHRQLGLSHQLSVGFGL